MKRIRELAGNIAKTVRKIVHREQADVKEPRKCILCGRETTKWQHILPSCDYYDPGGFCEKTGGACIFEDDVICEQCLKERDGDPTIYVGDACLDLYEEEYDEEYEEEEWE